MINIAILGFGIIGSGVADVIDENNEVISKKTDGGINIKHILDLKKIEGRYASCQAENIDVILNDPEIALIVEAMGGSHPAFEFSVRAMKAGKNVVTSNKEVVANFGAELLKCAVENNVSYLFEASVGGGIPIIRPIYNCLAANKINSVAAILNGTTNFILTQMIKNNKGFDDALSDAQRNGYAERDPSADIDGFDSCRKICILSSLVFGKQIPPEKVHTEGIRNIDLTDIHILEKHDYKIKLIAKTVSKPGGKIHAIVAPHLVGKDSPLYNIEDVYNGVLVSGNAIGEVMFYGKGAGKLPTASAIVADIIDALNKNTKNIIWESGGEDFIGDYKEESAGVYVRTKSVAHDPESYIKDIFADSEVYNTPSGEVYFFSKPLPEYEVDGKLAVLAQKGFEIITKIRIA